jgi:hypothetical protein
VFRPSLTLARRFIESILQRDRRAEVRHRPDRHTPPRATAAFGGAHWLAEVLNVNAEGVRLTAPDEVPVGGVVAVTLSNPSGLFARTLRVCVRHVQPAGNGRYAFDGTFGGARLTHDELVTLFAQPHLR